MVKKLLVFMFLFGMIYTGVSTEVAYAEDYQVGRDYIEMFSDIERE